MSAKLKSALIGVGLIASVAGGLAMTVSEPQRAPEGPGAPSGSPSDTKTTKGPQKRSQPRTAHKPPTSVEFASAALKEAKKGVSGRPNIYTKWYAAQPFAKEYADFYGGFTTKAYETSAWCAMFFSYLTTKNHLPTGNADDALAAGMANEFRKQGRLSSKPGLGRAVFFDFVGSPTRSGISHIGIVVGYTDYSVKVVEGNVDNSVKVSWRKRSDVVGYGVPYFRSK